jgi:hypothetical protein
VNEMMTKVFALILSLSLSSAAFTNEKPKRFTDPKIGGTVKLSKEAEAKFKPGGVLFISARNPGAGGPPVAVTRVNNPRFPQAFVLGPKNVMIAGVPFEGPFEIKAKYTLSGDALSKEGALEGDTGSKAIDLSERSIEIILK